MKFAINTPAELTDAELESVYGGWSNDNGSSAAAAVAAAHSSSVRVHSFSLVCDISIFSLNAPGLVINLANIASPNCQTCINNH